MRSDLMYAGRETCSDPHCVLCSFRSFRPPQLWRSRPSRGLLRDVQAVIAPSAFLARQFEKFLGVRAVIIPNFAPRAKTHRSSDSPSNRAVFVGGLERSKGLDVISEAFSSATTGPALRVVGTGSLEGEIRKKAAASKGRIEVLGQLSLDKVEEEISGAGCLLAFSRINENCPLSVVEAFSNGTPVVVNDRGGLPELIADGEAGVVVRLEPGAIARAVQEMLSSGSNWKRMSRSAREQYEKRYSPEAYMARYLPLVKAIMEGQS
jgi:glycosyltransferase involved in cell wall biosynthesis